MMHYAASHTFLSHDCGGRTLDQVLFFSYLNVLQHFHHSPGTYSRDHSYNPLHADNKHHKKKKSAFVCPFDNLVPYPCKPASI